MMNIDRRRFLWSAAATGVATAAATHLVSDVHVLADEPKIHLDRFCAFTESFQSWPIPKVCEKFASIGLDGLDLTVRPGGHIAPEDAGKLLPEATAAAQKSGVRILMLTTAINNIDANAERIIATCGELGIDRIKLGYFPYKDFGGLLSSIDDARARIHRIAELAHQHGVLPCVHIHSGAIIPASGAVAYLLFRDFKPTEVGAYVDPMHMTVEGGLDGWRQGLDLLAPWISISSMKNCVWVSEGRDKHGQERWDIRKCPVADGVAPIPDFISTLQSVGYHGLYSMHSEYQGDGSWKSLDADEALAQTKIDLDYVKGLVTHRDA